MRCKGQLSIEYLLLLAAALSVFAVLLPVLNSVFSASLFALDSANGKNFSLSLQDRVGMLSFQADGASQSIQFRPFGKWRIYSINETLFIEVSGPAGRIKAFEVIFPNSVEMPGILLENEKATFSLKKQSGKILLVRS